MHNSIHGVVAMLTRDVHAHSPISAAGVPCRSESIHLLLEDGSEYLLPEILVPSGEQSLTLRSSAWALKVDRRRPEQRRSWRMLRPSRHGGEMVSG